MSPDARLARRRALTELGALYHQAEELFAGWHCARSGACCQLAKAGREPYAWHVEWLRIQESLARAGRPPPRADGACALLDGQGRCSVYADRPLGCRTFYCEKGAGPRAVSRTEVTALMVRLERIAQALDPEETGPRPLRLWLREQGDAG